MKKGLLAGLSIILALAMGACGTEGQNGKRESQGEVVLGNYKGLKAERSMYAITEADIDNELANRIEEYIEYKSVERPAEEGDYVEFDLRSSVDGQELEEYTGEGYGVNIGYEDYGQEFDEYLVGVEVGQEKNFSINYGEDYWDEYFAGHTVDFELKITRIEEQVVPELTEDFLSENFGCSNEEEFRVWVEEQLREQNRQSAEETMETQLLQQIIDSSKFEGYSDELYEKCKMNVEAEYLSYAEWFGCSSLEEVYETFGMSQEDVEDYILNNVYEHLIIDEIARKENIEVDNSAYKEGKEALVKKLEYEDLKSLEDEYEEDQLRYMVLKDKIVSLIVANAEITEVEVSQDTESVEDSTQEIK